MKGAKNFSWKGFNPFNSQLLAFEFGFRKVRTENPIRIFNDEYVERFANNSKIKIHLSAVDKKSKLSGIARLISGLLTYV